MSVWQLTLFLQSGSLYFSEILRGSLKGQKLTEPNFLEKFFFGNNPEISSKVGLFLAFTKISFFNSKMVHNIVLYDSAKLPVWEKSGFSVIPQNALNQSICRFLWSSMSRESINRSQISFAQLKGPKGTWKFY